MRTPTSYLFKTKAQTLMYLSDLLGCSTIPSFTFFKVNEWFIDRNQVLDNLSKQFNGLVIIRSSTMFEDIQSVSGAGEFDSVLNVDSGNRLDLENAISRVLEAYIGKIDSKHISDQEILVQEMVNDVSMSGVVFTFEVKTGAPYYVINYDDITGRTDTVTSGEGEYSNRTLYVYRNATNSVKSFRFRALLKSIDEIERKLNRMDLDIEFAQGKDFSIHLLQVRPITTLQTPNEGFKLGIDEKIFSLASNLKSRFSVSPRDFGAITAFGQMPDWNPAEMLGRVPRPLAISLYERLITTNVWSKARGLMGYKVPADRCLMKTFAGQPFIDVRLSFNSLLPKNLSNSTSEALIDHWVSRLVNEPEKHDKVEFEIAITAYTFDIDARLSHLVGGAISDPQKRSFTKELNELTKNLINGTNEGSIETALRKIRILDRRNKARDWRSSELNDLDTLLNECIELGTLPFAILARHAFIATTILSSFVEKNLTIRSEMEGFKSSIKTVASELVVEIMNVVNGISSIDNFLDNYGHLRPGTYDILSPRYDQMENLLIQQDKWNFPVESGVNLNFEFSVESLKNIDDELRKIGWNEIDAEKLLRYCSNSIKYREYAKFIFTRTVSDILEIIAYWGKSRGISREMLSFLTLDELKNYSTKPNELRKEKIEKLYHDRVQDHRINSAIRLPTILHDSAGVHVIPFQVSQPNFITQKRVEGRLLVLTGGIGVDDSLDGKIVLIENADPGFDWIFSKNIKGLITKYGGANSHMAIRCAEFNIPAAIGCGEQRYNRIVTAHEILLDCNLGILQSKLGHFAW